MLGCCLTLTCLCDDYSRETPHRDNAGCLETFADFYVRIHRYCIEKKEKNQKHTEDAMANPSATDRQSALMLMRL